MKRRLMSLALLTVLLLAALPALAQADPVVILTVFSGPRAEFSPDGSLLAVYQDANFAVSFETPVTPNTTAIHMFDPSTGELVESLVGARDFVSGLLFTPDGAQLIAVLANGEVLTWDTSSGDLVSVAQTPLLGPRLPLFWHPRTGELVAASQDFSHTSYVSLDPPSGAISLLTRHPDFDTYSDFRAQQEERQSSVYNDIVVVPFPQSDALAGLPVTGDEVWTVNVQGQIALLSLATGETQVLREGDDRPSFAIQDLMATDSGLIGYAVSSDDTFYLLDFVHQEEKEIPIEHPSALLSPDGAIIAGYNEEGTALVVMTLADGKTQTLALPEGLETLRPLMRLRYRPDSAQVAVGGLRDAEDHGVIVLYDL